MLYIDDRGLQHLVLNLKLGRAFLNLSFKILEFICVNYFPYTRLQRKILQFLKAPPLKSWFNETGKLRERFCVHENRKQWIYGVVLTSEDTDHSSKVRATV